MRLPRQRLARTKALLTNRGYNALPGIATQFLHLHEAASRRNVADGDVRKSTSWAQPTTRKRDNGGFFGKSSANWRGLLADARDGHPPTLCGQWSQKPVMEWLLRRRETIRRIDVCQCFLNAKVLHSGETAKLREGFWRDFNNILKFGADGDMRKRADKYKTRR